MQCNDIIISPKERNGRFLLIPWSHYKAVEVIMTDGSRANLPTCSDCYKLINTSDFPLLEKKLRYEWMQQQLRAYKGKPDRVQKLIDAATMCKSKKIERRI